MNVNLPNSQNVSMIVFVGLYVMIWAFVSVSMFRFRTMKGCSMYLFFTQSKYLYLFFIVHLLQSMESFFTRPN